MFVVKRPVSAMKILHLLSELKAQILLSVTGTGKTKAVLF